MIKVKSAVCKEVTNFSDEKETNTTDYESSLKNAQKSTKKQKRMPQCYICNTDFSFEKDLMIHFTQMHEENKPYKCTLCDFKFKKKGQMKKHVESAHEKKKPIKCFCGSFFSNREGLKAHMLSTHSGLIEKI